MSVPDGCYPRLNAALCLSNQYDGALISVVGRFHGHAQQFQCSDGGTISLNTDHIEQPSSIDASGQGMVVELVGQWMEGRLVVSSVMMEHSFMDRRTIPFTNSLFRLQVFVVRELSKDMDLGVYEKMIQVQQHPKYQHYFDLSTSTQ